jgi:transposase-like protein
VSGDTVREASWPARLCFVFLVRRWIRRLAGAGKSHRQIEKITGVSRSCVARTLRDSARARERIADFRPELVKKAGS